MKKLIFHPMFITGLGIRVALFFFLVPLPITQWYAPFLDVSTSVLTVDPWATWINHGGSIIAFPYGTAMWLVFIPATLIAKLLGISICYAYGLTILIADFFLLLTLDRLLPKRQRFILLTYWLSPIVIVASYGLGLNDLVPALLLFLSILFIREIKLKLAGAFLAAAISAKLSMIVALPFFVIYFYHNRALRQRLLKFQIGFSVSILLFGAPFILSQEGVQMLISNPEMGKIYQLAFDLAGNVSIYVVPLIYLVMLYIAWRVQRFNFDLFQATTGVAFLLIVLLMPSSPGWFVWSLPFLAFYQAISDRIAILLVSLFSGMYVLSTLLVSRLQINGHEILLDSVFNILDKNIASIIHTGMVAFGLILAIRIWREAISKNEFFRLSRKPFTIGIAGDSGSGKDTFANAITGLFGKHSVVKLSGDDYHLWDRQKPIWQVMTHLNPRANDLEGFYNDLISLTDGKSVQSRHYDHKTGRMSKPYKLKSNDFIIASGLHTLYLQVLRKCYNLKIYLDIDEGLRRYFKLERDVHQRGYTVEKVLTSFKKRQSDSEHFVQPQSKYADLVLSLQPIHPRMLEDSDKSHPIRLKLVVRTRSGFNELSMHRALVGVCGLQVDIIIAEDNEEFQMTIEGDTSADDIEMAAQMLCPHVLEFLDITPEWQDGVLGLMQLITLSHINQELTEKII